MEPTTTTERAPATGLASLWGFPRIMLLDGVGALVTALSVGVVLPLLEPWVGLPVPVLRGLGAAAAVFAAYSLSRHVGGRTSAESLRRIATANLAYCVATAAVLALYAQEATALAFAYFLGEIAIVVTLSARELSLARQAPRGG